MAANMCNHSTSNFVEDTTDFVSELYSNAETQGANYG